MHKSLTALLLAGVLATPNALAAALNTTVQNEVDYLFNYLKDSNCTFSRNGSWYSADEAVDHLTTKYNYIVRKGWLDTTEHFIERAATKSSISGKPYLVKCAEVQSNSADWFNQALAEYRKNH